MTIERLEELKNLKQELTSMQIEAIDSVNKRLIYTPTIKTKFSDIYADVVNQTHSLIDAEIERQKPCDACDNGKHGKNFKIDIGFGERISLNFCYCPTCGRKLD